MTQVKDGKPAAKTHPLEMALGLLTAITGVLALAGVVLPGGVMMVLFYVAVGLLLLLCLPVFVYLLILWLTLRLTRGRTPALRLGLCVVALCGVAFGVPLVFNAVQAQQDAAKARANVWPATWPAHRTLAIVYDQPHQDWELLCDELCQTLLYKGEVDSLLIAWADVHSGPTLDTLSYTEVHLEKRPVCPPLTGHSPFLAETSHNAERLITGDCLIVGAGDVRKAGLILRPDAVEDAAPDFTRNTRRLEAWQWTQRGLKMVAGRSLTKRPRMAWIWLPYREVSTSYETHAILFVQGDPGVQPEPRDPLSALLTDELKIDLTAAAPLPMARVRAAIDAGLADTRSYDDDPRLQYVEHYFTRLRDEGKGTAEDAALIGRIARDRRLGGQLTWLSSAVEVLGPDARGLSDVFLAEMETASLDGEQAGKVGRLGDLSRAFVACKPVLTAKTVARLKALAADGKRAAFIPQAMALIPAP